MFIAICWTIVLIADIITCALGSAPSWTLVFCPLIVLVMESWINVYNKSLDNDEEE